MTQLADIRKKEGIDKAQVEHEVAQ